MKNKRHELIIKLISENEISTQEELQKKLNESGCNVTQATISRDINKLALLKISDKDGKYRYSLPSIGKLSGHENSFLSIITDGVISADHAMNTVAVKCHTGMAQAVCAKLDTANIDNVVGTIAGDDTIFILMRTERDASRLVKELKQMIAE
ncbi:MAG: arginine repressor [Ruminococcus sp.]|nr:arginine repressor [Ruminococcus sp.]